MTKEPSNVEDFDQDPPERLNFRSSGHNQLRGATKQTQNLLEGLSISSDLGTSQDPPGGAGVLLGRKTSGIPCRHIEQTPDKQKKMDSLSRC